MSEDLPRYILDLSASSADGDVDHAVRMVLEGGKQEQHALFFVEIVGRTQRSRDDIQNRFRDLGAKLEAKRGRELDQEFQKAVPLAARLKLRSLLVARGVAGEPVPGDRNAMQIVDPLKPDGKIVVRDACVFGFRPIIEGAVAPDDSLTDLTRDIPEAEIAQHCLRHEEAAEIMKAIKPGEDEGLRRVPPHEYQLPNLEVLDAAGADDLELMFLELNRRFAVIDLDGQIKVYDSQAKTLYDETNFYRSCKRKVKIGEGKRAKWLEVAKLWFGWPARAFYAGRRLYPDGMTGEGRSYVDDPALCSYLNSWQGYAVTPRKGDWLRMQDHILNVLCRGDRDANEYLLNWMAHRLQKPWQKPRVAIVTWGEIQIGKSMVADELRKIIGPAHTAILNKKGEVVSQFVDLSRVTFSQSEEALYAGDPSTVSIVKHNVTSDTVRVEVKHEMAEDRPSYTGYWFTGNDTNPVRVTHGEERFFVLHVSDSRKGDKAYFNAILEQMRNGGREAMLHDLLGRDLSRFDILEKPSTEAFGKMVMDQLPKKERPVAEMLHEGAIVIRDRDGKVEKRIPLRPDGHTTIEADDLYRYLGREFAEYGESHGRVSKIGGFLKDLGIVVRHVETDSRREVKAAYVLHGLADMRATLAKRWHVQPRDLGQRDAQDRETTTREILLAALEDARQAHLGLKAVEGQEDKARTLEDLIETLEADLCRSKFANDNARAA